jgi:hypothetical protein
MSVHAIHKGRRRDDPPFYCECGQALLTRQAAVDHVNTVAATGGPVSYPDVVGEPATPPSVEGTDVTRPL